MASRHLFCWRTHNKATTASIPLCRSHPLKPHPNPYRSKTIAAWLALLLGALGVHRLYLNGLHDRLAWLYMLPTVVGSYGALRMRSLGQDDVLSWLLIPLLGLMLSVGMLTAIVHALTPDDKWDARHNPGHAVTATGWGAVMAAIIALLLGGMVLMATIAFSAQKFFEWELDPTPTPVQTTSQLSQ